MGEQLTAHDIALFYDANCYDFLKFFSKATDSYTIAQDLIQTLFTRILKKASSINNLNGYAWSAARNLVKDYYRSESRQPKTTTYHEGSHLSELYPRDITADLIDSLTDEEIDFILCLLDTNHRASILDRMTTASYQRLSDRD